MPIPKIKPGNAEPHIEAVASGKATMATLSNPINARKADINCQTITRISISGFFIGVLLVSIYSKIEAG